MSEVIQSCIGFAIGAAVLWMLEMGLTIPKSSSGTRSTAWKMSWEAAHLRIATSDQVVEGSVPALVADGERLVTAFRVVLCENVRMSRRPPIGGRQMRKSVWSTASELRGAVIVAPVDAGTLIVTDRRVIYRGTNKYREFSMRELVIESINGTIGGIALTSRACRRIAYFTRWRGLCIKVPVTREVSGHPITELLTFNFAPFNLKAVLQLLQNAPPLKVLQ